MTADELYDAYVPAIGSPEMTISRQMARLLDRVARQQDVKFILDLGSGLSSAIFRNIPQRVVITYDTSQLWLDRTKQFLMDRKLPHDDLYLLHDADVPSDKYDLVFHDLGDMLVRKQTLPFAVNSAGKYLILDDLHFDDYRQHALALLSDPDGYGRYGLAFVR